MVAGVGLGKRAATFLVEAKAQGVVESQPMARMRRPERVMAYQTG